MTDNTEPTIDELVEMCFDDLCINNTGNYIRITFGDKSMNVDYEHFLAFRKRIEALISDQVAKARIDEIHAWFDMPKHYPGEEYLDEPFAKAKCKTPKKITYYTLDSSFTYSLKERLATLNGVNNNE